MINFILGVFVGAAIVMGIFMTSFFDDRWNDGWNRGVEARHMMDELRDLTQKMSEITVWMPKSKNFEK